MSTKQGNLPSSNTKTTKSPSCPINVTKSYKRKKALELIRVKGYTKAEAARAVGVSRPTIKRWINKILNNYTQLPPDKRVSYWEHESLSDRYTASLIRDMLLGEVLRNPSSVSPSEKRAIWYSGSMSSGLSWDKAHPKADIPVINIDLRGEIRESRDRIEALRRSLLQGGGGEGEKEGESV